MLMWVLGLVQAAARVSRLEEELVALKGREGAAREQVQALQQQLEQLEADRSAAADQISSLQQQLAHASQQLGKAVADREVASSEASSLAERLSTLEASKAALESSAREDRARAQSIEQELQEKVSPGA